MRILHISDTHGFHERFPNSTFNNIDVIIHSGDASNSKDVYINEKEIRDFIKWYETIPVKHKIYVPGNHDGSIERGLVTKKDFIENNITYLLNEELVIQNFRIWGSPYTPSFNNWSFMIARDKIERVWSMIPEETDILVVHGPPKHIRDLSYDRNNNLEFCGDRALGRYIEKISPKLVCFGHIHNCKEIVNSGISINYPSNTIYSNASCVTDAKFDFGLTSYGNIINLTNE